MKILFLSMRIIAQNKNMYSVNKTTNRAIFNSILLTADGFEVFDIFRIIQSCKITKSFVISFIPFFFSFVSVFSCISSIVSIYHHTSVNRKLREFCLSFSLNLYFYICRYNCMTFYIYLYLRLCL